MRKIAFILVFRAGSVFPVSFFRVDSLHLKKIVQ
jgi:hypothetical protein